MPACKGLDFPCHGASRPMASRPVADPWMRQKGGSNGLGNKLLERGSVSWPPTAHRSLSFSPKLLLRETRFLGIARTANRRYTPFLMHLQLDSLLLSSVHTAPGQKAGFKRTEAARS
jgi:hypothetical protein